MSQLKAGRLLHGFRLRQSFDVPEFRLWATELQHERTASKFWHFQRSDPNRTFSVQFRTTPQDDSGVSHILEHTVLCGSKKYPVSDPFFKMLHRSVANFMNAMTANDWTMYPFSTLNDTDFRNLLRVYTDAVFNPQLKELSFIQEGWRLEPKDLSDKRSKLHIKGIVFNEMKGVFSDSLARFGQSVQNALLPKTYGFVSGGHPDSIPTLSWDDLKKFHQSCYHPSNACFYTYGDTNLEQCLEFLNDEHLKHYTAIHLDNEVQLEPVWIKPRSLELTCQPDPMAPDPDRQSVVALSYRLNDIRNVYENFVLQLLSNLLLDGDNAPLYRGLIESGYGLDWVSGMCGVDQQARTVSFHVGVQGVTADSVSDFDSIVVDILRQVVRDGLPHERVDAVLHQYELAMRRDSARFGLHLIFALSHAVNHSVDMKDAMRIGHLIDRFRADMAANPSLFQDLIQKYLLDNPHKLCTSMKPDESWQTKQVQHDYELERNIVAAVSADEQDLWATKCCELTSKQQEAEDLSCLPCLDLTDIPIECHPEPFTVTEVLNCPVQLNEAPTNELVYFHSLADLQGLDPELLIYVPLFCTLFPRLGADNCSYSEMDQAIELHTGGLDASALTTPQMPTNQSDGSGHSRLAVHLSGYCLQSKLPKFFDLWSKLLRAPDWSDRKRLQTLIYMSALGDWSANAISGSAHQFAVRRAAANLSMTCRVQELWYGLEQAALMNRVGNRLRSNDENVEQVLSELTDRMLTIWTHIVNPKRLRFSLHADSSGLGASLQHMNELISCLPAQLSGTRDHRALSLEPLAKMSYISMPYTVHHAGQAFSAPGYDSPDYASYRVLSHLLTSKFLHREIREKGGAYGGRAIAKPEALVFFSYRDPHAQQTLHAFENALDWALSADFSVQDVNEAKLSVFQQLDQPVASKDRGLTHFLHDIDDGLRQTHRAHVFAVDSDKLRTAANHLKSVQCTSGCVVLGPDQSSDWTPKNPSEWERIDLRDH